MPTVELGFHDIPHDTRARWHLVLRGLVSWVSAGVLGCATPSYVVRSAPQPDESASIVRIEQAISSVQAEGFERQGARAIAPGERLWGFGVQAILDRLSRVTERPSLHYQAFLYHDQDPNAAALADGRVYLTTGMLEYLARRGSREGELAFVVAHEVAHTVAQHLVKRYHALYQRQVFMSLVAAGAALATQGAGSAGQEARQLALDGASLLNDLAISGYSQDQELEADQFGIRYVMRAGFNPQAALDLLQDFSRFEGGWPFFRTHPYATLRREHLQHYLDELGWGGLQHPIGQDDRSAVEGRLQHLRSVQQQYPVGSVSWKNLQRQIETLEGLSR